MSLVPAVNSNDHVLNADGLIELVEYGDFQCPYCGRAYPIVRRLKNEFGVNLKFVFRNFPLKKIHAQAKEAAMAAEAAGLQNKFWEMHDLLFENQTRLNNTSLLHYALLLSLDIEQFKSDIQREDLSDKIDEHFMSGLKSGVNATPTFFINGQRYQGSWEYEIFSDYLRKMIIASQSMGANH